MDIHFQLGSWLLLQVGLVGSFWVGEEKWPQSWLCKPSRSIPTKESAKWVSPQFQHPEPANLCPSHPPSTLLLVSCCYCAHGLMVQPTDPWTHGPMDPKITNIVKPAPIEALKVGEIVEIFEAFKVLDFFIILEMFDNYEVFENLCFSRL